MVSSNDLINLHISKKGTWKIGTLWGDCRKSFEKKAYFFIVFRKGLEWSSWRNSVLRDNIQHFGASRTPKLGTILFNHAHKTQGFIWMDFFMVHFFLWLTVIWMDSHGSPVETTSFEEGFGRQAPVDREFCRAACHDSFSSEEFQQIRLPEICRIAFLKVEPAGGNAELYILQQWYGTIWNPKMKSLWKILKDMITVNCFRISSHHQLYHFGSPN